MLLARQISQGASFPALGFPRRQIDVIGQQRRGTAAVAVGAALEYGSGVAGDHSAQFSSAYRHGALLFLWR